MTMDPIMSSVKLCYADIIDNGEPIPIRYKNYLACDSLIIGRSSLNASKKDRLAGENSFNFDERTLSMEHLEIQFDDFDGFLLEDLNSTHGSLILHKSKDVTVLVPGERTPIEQGDIICLTLNSSKALTIEEIALDSAIILSTKVFLKFESYDDYIVLIRLNPSSVLSLISADNADNLFRTIETSPCSMMKLNWKEWNDYDEADSDEHDDIESDDSAPEMDVLVKKSFENDTLEKPVDDKEMDVIVVFNDIASQDEVDESQSSEDNEVILLNCDETSCLRHSDTDSHSDEASTESDESASELDEDCSDSESSILAQSSESSIDSELSDSQSVDSEDFDNEYCHGCCDLECAKFMIEDDASDLSEEDTDEEELESPLVANFQIGNKRSFDEDDDEELSQPNTKLRKMEQKSTLKKDFGLLFAGVALGSVFTFAGLASLGSQLSL